MTSAAAAATDTADVAAQERGHLDNKLLMKLAIHELTPKEQFNLGVLLEMEPSTIRQLMCEEAVTSTFAILEAWRNSRRSSGNYSATYDQLCDAYLELKRADIAENIRKEQIRLAKEEIKLSREELVLYKQKHDDGTRQLNEQVRVLKDEALKTKDGTRQLNEQVRVLKDEALKTKGQQTNAKDALQRFLLKTKKLEEEIRRLTEQASALKTEVNTYKQAFEDGTRQLNEQVTVLEGRGPENQGK
ncbi:hypothetical protein LSAT2_020552 [Lamellibrachia satsuma]|nr:hypothetical protein LSAT2_020552 [Lamellibrachia satsuma]